MKLGKPNSKVAVVAGAVGGFVAALALGYLVLISPQRSEAGALDDRIAATQGKIDAYRASSRNPQKPLRFAELFSLAKAMPDEEDMPDVLLELSRIADGTGIVINSISPRVAAAGTGFRRLPLEVSLEGSFYDLSDFLFRLRNLVTVRDGSLDATGRLLTVDSVEFGEGSKRFPQLLATVTMSAFVYDGGPAAPPAAAGEGGVPPSAAPEGAPTALGATD